MIYTLLEGERWPLGVQGPPLRRKIVSCPPSGQKTASREGAIFLFFSFLFILEYIGQGTHCTGKTAKNVPCQDSEFGDFAKTQGKHREFCLLKL